MTKRSDALTKALETTTPGRRNIIDILTEGPGISCSSCGADEATIRRWTAPVKDAVGRWQTPKKDDRPVLNRAGFLCNGCESRVTRSLVYLRAASDAPSSASSAQWVTKAIQEIQRVAS